jgi:hypothetical protein
MANRNGFRIGIVAGLVAAVVSMLLPSPVTIATFKPWASADKSVRITFWTSIGLVSVAIVFALANGDWE